MADNTKFALGRGDMPRPRRVVTAPVTAPPSQPKPSPPSTSSRPEDLVETLYNHPSVKIISFTSTQHSPLVSRSSAERDQAGTLPASSRLERTIAVGPFCIYRVPGSVVFLSCGSALQPILPKSQCWSINEDNSRFVLQIRRPQYWRIELPVSEPDDQERALQLRDIFDKVLLFEKTICPFERSFTVLLPEEEEVKKRAWTPDGKNLISSRFLSELASPMASRLYGRERRDSAPTDEITRLNIGLDTHREHGESEDRHDDEPAVQMPTKTPRASSSFMNIREKFNQTSPRRASDHIAVPGSVTTSRDHLEDESVTSQKSRDDPSLAIDEDKSIMQDGKQVLASERHNGGSAQPREEFLQDSAVSDSEKRKVTDKEVVNEPSSFEGSGHIAPINLTRKRMSRVLAGRAYTAPPQLTVVTSPPSKSRASKGGPAQANPPEPAQPTASEETSPVGSTDSFHSVQSWHSPVTPLPPSPPSSRPATPSIPQFPHPHENIVLPQRSPRARDNLTYSNTPDTDRTFLPTDHRTDSTVSPLPRSPDIDDDHVSPIPVDGPSGAAYTSALEERHQARPRPRPRQSFSVSRQALSPLPSAVNFFSPPRMQSPQSRMSLVRRLPSTIISKTLEYLLGPPSYLISLMLKVAAKIIAGEWRGLVFGRGEGGEAIPVQWDYSDDEFSDWSGDEDFAMAKCEQSKSNSSTSIPRASNSYRQDSDSTDGGYNRSSEVD
ncbi:inheritance of peroxisomes protein 1-domain-containing protein [Hypoxylon rubiginosum]|uniref:Inheritance of peroxisomes protein 1-domain-containing protein n=1 Tax=Hypoxylon rubiginosum TaxID=110542 RepID=A0ACC0CR12_9PEZI|nr:inheritance of peroxisomes protein 1-domain-containing protein [Hypoxylon rubiginosum]